MSVRRRAIREEGVGDYLGRLPPRGERKDAWAALVPFRVRLGSQIGLTIGAPTLAKPSYVLFEVFLYPYGIAVCATVRVLGDFTLDQASQLALDIRKSKEFTLQDAVGARRSLSLDALASECLSQVSDRLLGPEVNPRPTSKDAFTIVTVVKGTGVRSKVSIKEYGTIHALLDSLTVWANRATEDLPKIEDAKLTIQKTPPADRGDIMYGKQLRARTIWYPRRFTEAVGDHPSLACYHRNLVYATLQVESLCGLMEATAQMLDAGQTLDSLSSDHRQCAQQAAGALGRLYGGRDSYRSYSTRDQMEQSGYVNYINMVRAAFAAKGNHMPPLTA